MNATGRQRETITLLAGLLMTFSSPLADASDSHWNNESLLTDFSSRSSDLRWYVVNDNVMGGRSEGTFRQDNGELIFTGRTNTNGGGFSSIRTGPLQLDLSEHEGIRLFVKGDGRRYTWRLTTDASWRGNQVSYWADFDTSADTWSTVDIPFSSFVPQFRGRELKGPPLDSVNITGMGLMIYDKQDGPFEAQLASVRAYSADTPFSLDQHRWKIRTLVISAPSTNAADLEVQQAEVARYAEEFADRDMVLITLLEDAASTVGDRELTTGEAAALRDALRIRPGSFAVRLVGKDGSVKLSRDTATPMAEIYALIDTMPMRRREVAERR
jgi:hypothetical protein